MDDDGHDRSMGKSHSHNPSKRFNVRKVVIGPFFEGETEADAALAAFEMQFLMGKSNHLNLERYHTER